MPILRRWRFLLCNASSLLALMAASSGAAVNIEWVSVGHPGNDCDPHPQGCFGGVAYPFQIGKFEVTNAQFAEFLNSKAANADPLLLYHPSMGIGRVCSPEACSYSAISGQESKPVRYVSFFDALRFANWMNNGQGSGDTETGAYTLTGGTPLPTNYATVTRNAGTAVFVASEDEWYKAAYHNASGIHGTDYFTYPTGTEAEPTCSSPSALANHMNCNSVVGDVTVVGSYAASPSPHGTFDQGGNVHEWNETNISSEGSETRVYRGGSYPAAASYSRSGPGNPFAPWAELPFVGFRVVPEPGATLQLAFGILALPAIAGRRIAGKEMV